MKSSSMAQWPFTSTTLIFDSRGINPRMHQQVRRCIWRFQHLAVSALSKERRIRKFLLKNEFFVKEAVGFVFFKFSNSRADLSISDIRNKENLIHFISEYTTKRTTLMKTSLYFFGTFAIKSTMGDMKGFLPPLSDIDRSFTETAYIYEWNKKQGKSQQTTSGWELTGGRLLQEAKDREDFVCEGEPGVDMSKECIKFGMQCQEITENHANPDDLDDLPDFDDEEIERVIADTPENFNTEFTELAHQRKQLLQATETTFLDAVKYRANGISILQEGKHIQEIIQHSNKRLKGPTEIHP